MSKEEKSTEEFMQEQKTKREIEKKRKISELNSISTITDGENNGCNWCWFEGKQDEDYYEYKKIGAMYWKGYSICINCVDEAMDEYFKETVEKYWWNCGVCRKPFPEERKKFEKDNADLFGICGGPIFVCET